MYRSFPKLWSSVRLSFPSAKNHRSRLSERQMDERMDTIWGWNHRYLRYGGMVFFPMLKNPRNLRRFETYVTLQLEAKLVPHYVMYYMTVYYNNITLHYPTLHYIIYIYIAGNFRRLRALRKVTHWWSPHRICTAIGFLHVGKLASNWATAKT